MDRRHITTAATLVVLLLVLAGMAVFGVRALTAPLPDRSAGGPACSSAERQVQEFVTRRDVQVSVYNAGSISGRAGTVLETLEEAGFRGGNAGNAPADVRVQRAVVWTTEADDSAAELVAASLGPRTRVEVVPEDLGPGVDVLVGDRQISVSPDAPRRVRLPQPVEKCIDVS
ncbi:hypothetical protein ASG49_13015 [Marmoricola sp. Leaf446]|uniref:LytR C-terminal domain-containing protein n=1 Tax=Marmoricola sp. Leaf446 TaxID=1736379 RepID=UPI0006FDBB6D|nr:LytR C-terminal domain-containing protein [Marmoricola sp. Leaf446]KQT90677.1 hypothetical protein ASG49_13015 [Marmoricola sp. Leaf446]